MIKPGSHREICGMNVVSINTGNQAKAMNLNVGMNALLASERATEDPRNSIGAHGGVTRPIPRFTPMIAA